MKQVADGGIDVTGGDQILLAMCASHEGLRDLADRRGFWSRESMPDLASSWESDARRMLNLFGDWKMDAEEITDVCQQARKLVGI